MDIESIAAMARLSLSDGEKQKIQRDIEDFSDFASILRTFSEGEQLDACHAEGVEALREDIAAERASIADGYICVPLTLEVEQ